MKFEELNCTQVMHHICENLKEDLESERCKAIKKHLEECVDCQNYFKTVEQTIEFYKKYNIELSEECHNRLMDFLGLK